MAFPVERLYALLRNAISFFGVHPKLSIGRVAMTG
jgi:hypothetical protein